MFGRKGSVYMQNARWKCGRAPRAREARGPPPAPERSRADRLHGGCDPTRQAGGGVDGAGDQRRCGEIIEAAKQSVKTGRAVAVK